VTVAETMVRCAATNLAYMRATPAGKAGYGAVVRLYHRLAAQGLACAQAWAARGPCPPHEPAVDAFWWGVAAWAPMFSVDVLCWAGHGDDRLLHHELQEAFCRPHLEFARWLRPLRPEERGARLVSAYFPRAGSATPGRMVLRHDAAWTRLVIRLTAGWGLLHHLKDLPALGQALLLLRHLERWPDPVARAYLESDLAFLRELFGHFDFTPGLRAALESFLARAGEEVASG
jgi:hypothetical protein